MKEPLISIIVPAYNIAPYLPRCLESIRNQIYQNLEVIIVDDGSIDESGQIADEYHNRYPDFFRCIHLENGGVTRARLKGVIESSGEWISFVDGDDEIEQDMYSRLMYNAQNYKADISHCGYQTIVNDGERIHYFYNTGRIEIQDKEKGLIDLLSGEFVEPGLCNKLFRRRLVEKVIDNNFMDYSIKINEDLMMNYILFSNAEVSVYEDFCPYHYMARNSSVTRSQLNKNKIYDPVKVWDWIIANSERKIKMLAEKGHLLACINAFTALSNYPEFKQEAKIMRKKIIEQKNKWGLLSRKSYLKVRLIQWMPMVYSVIYSIYVKFFQKKKYE